MNYLQFFGEWSSWTWRLLVNHLWQATLFFAVAFVATVLLRRGPARARYIIWLAASLKLAVPSALLVFLLNTAGVSLSSTLYPTANTAPALKYLSPAISAVVVPAGYLQEKTEPQPREGHGTSPGKAYQYHPISVVLSITWLVGACLFAIRWWKRRRDVCSALQAGRIAHSGRERESLNRVISWLGVRRAVALVISPEVKEPGVWRSVNPVVLLPEKISSQLNDDEIDALIMHELIHILRWDNLVSNMQMVLCCLFWFNPIVWLIDRFLLQEREQACDEMVLRLGGSKQAYASSIRKIYRFCLGERVSGLSAAGGSNLSRRLERIITGNSDRRLSLGHRLLVISVFSLSLVLSLIAATPRRDPVAIGGKVPVAKVVTELVKQMERDVKDCVARPDEKCLPRSTEPLVAEEPLAKVEVRTYQDGSVTYTPSHLAALNSTPVPSNPEPAAKFESAHAVDLEKFAGRYAVDPSMMENFVFDVTVQDGELWLKPSHAPKRRLTALSSVEYVDSKSNDTRITFNWDGTGSVESFTLKGWGPTMVIRKLVLPPPSVEGNVTFRLSGFPDARIVAVAGTFNNWNQSQYLFSRIGGEWVCRIRLPRGKYQYKFIVDGNWYVDPRNPKVVHDEREIENSVLINE